VLHSSITPSNTLTQSPVINTASSV
jgi:hypothetical protein